MKNKYLRKLKIELVDGDFENPIKEQLRSPEDLYTIFNSIKDSAQETIIAVYTWKDLSPSVYSIMSVGNELETTFQPRDLFGQGYVLKADYIALIHNHPKGDPTPSPEDIEVMKEIKKRAWAADMRFLDFIIVGADSYWSMFEEADGGEYGLGGVG